MRVQHVPASRDERRRLAQKNPTPGGIQKKRKMISLGTRASTNKRSFENLARSGHVEAFIFSNSIDWDSTFFMVCVVQHLLPAAKSDPMEWQDPLEKKEAPRIAPEPKKSHWRTNTNHCESSVHCELMEWVTQCKNHSCPWQQLDTDHRSSSVHQRASNTPNQRNSEVHQVHMCICMCTRPSDLVGSSVSENMSYIIRLALFPSALHGKTCLFWEFCFPIVHKVMCPKKCKCCEISTVNRLSGNL